MPSQNQHILETLTTVADSYRSQGVVFKYKAYRTAIEAIRGFPDQIVSSSQVKHLPGIGKSMLEKIDEILATGKLAQEEDIKNDPVEQALKLFTSIHGVGPVLAKKLVHEKGLRTFQDLEAMDHLLPPAARLGMKYHEETSKRIPFDEIEEHLTFARKLIQTMIDPALTVCVCGSHRRMAETSGDIDLLLSHPASSSDTTAEYTFLPHFVKELRSVGYVLDVLAEGRHKFMGYCRLGPHGTVRRLDIRWFPWDHFFPALMYFTGSDLFNVNMRQRALRLGYTLSEYGLHEIAGYEHLHDPVVSAAATTFPQAGASKGNRMPVNSEEDIFRLLHMPFVAPKDRSK